MYVNSNDRRFTNCYLVFVNDLTLNNTRLKQFKEKYTMKTVSDIKGDK